MNSREHSLTRAHELQQKVKEYKTYKNFQLNVIKNRMDNYAIQKANLLHFFEGTEVDWNNWHWQIKNRITDAVSLSRFIPLSKQEIMQINEISKTNRFAIVPYYLSLITGEDDPIKKISVPSSFEILNPEGEIDPMDEKNTNPAGSITRRYPDRLIINVTNKCASYCRHCQRRRLINEQDIHTGKELLKESINYIKENPEIRDVLLTGGDALLLSNNQLEKIIKAIREIPHVEIIRIGTRTPVTMPMRITNNLVNMLKQYHPIYLNVHFNHPYEITTDSKLACDKLADAGIVLGNQAVLLRDINDDPYTMALLNQRLLELRVKPYYLFHAKNVKGTMHFIPRLEDGLRIMEFLRGNTSGLAIPTYIMNAPKGLGKVPLLPEYIVDKTNDTYTIRTWEGKEFKYTEK